MKRSILLLHGFKYGTEQYFLPFLKKRYEKDFDVAAPELPDPETPDIDAWTAVIEQMPRRDFAGIVAHSLGGVFALSLLSRHIVQTDFLALIGVSTGPKENAHMQTFLRYPLDFAAVRARVPHILTVQSFDDPWTTPECGIINVKDSKGTGIFYADKGHFETPDLPKDTTALMDHYLSFSPNA